MESIIAAIVGPFVTTALQWAVKRINDKSVTADLGSIQRCHTSVIEAIRNYPESHKDRSVPWRDKVAKLRSSSRDIEDCIDQFKIKKLTIENLAPKIKTIEEAVKLQTKDIEDYIEERRRIKNNIQVTQGQGSSSGSVQVQVQHDDIPRNPFVLVGIKEPREDLLALVLNSGNQQATSIPNVTKVISIVGSGGVGKTCLAAEVYLHQEVVESFALRAFVCAKDKDKDRVVQEVSRQLGTRSGNQRCFIVVDGVEEEKLGRDVISGCRSTVTRADDIIFMTTTVQRFAESWSSRAGHVYKMRPLSVELSGTLFKCYYPDVDVPKSKEVGKECDGVPLAVITWAEYWNQDPGRCEEVWRKFSDPELRDRIDDRMAKVLQHSYDSLPTIDQQTCLLYFSMFRREHTIRRGAVIRRWLAEGSEVGCGNLTDNHIPAFENWKRLVDWNAVCPVQVSINKDQAAKTCRPSGAMLGYICHKSGPEGFAIVRSEEEDPPQNIRRLSLQAYKPEIFKRDAVSSLRTLVVSPEKNNEIKAAALCFDDCGLLRVLDLQACSGPERISIVDNVCKKLEFLKYLSLGSAFISYVPQEIKRLKMLETLDVGKENVVEVHIDVLKLPKLKHLVGKIKPILSWGFWFNKELFQAKELETLSGFVTLEGKGFPLAMKYMIKLKKVKVFFDPEASSKSLSSRLAEGIKAFLGGSKEHPNVAQGRTLSIDIQKCQQSVLGALENIEGKPNSLYSLKLCGKSNLIALPSFIGNLEGIQKLCISFTTLSWQCIIDGQRHLPQLKFLKLVAEEKNSSIIGVSNQPIVGTSTTTVVEVLRIKVDQFKNLVRMCLQSAQTLPKIEIDVGALTELVSLHLISGRIGNPSEVICSRHSTNGIPPVNNPNQVANGIPPVNNPNQVAHEIPPLNKLKEVTLQSSSSVNVNIKTAWHQAARGHPKRPQVLFIEDPRNA